MKKSDEICLLTAERTAEDVRFTYTLTERCACGMPLFSLKVEEVFRQKREEIVLSDVTNRREEAERLFHLFCEGCVGVATAEDILVDLLYAY